MKELRCQCSLFQQQLSEMTMIWLRLALKLDAEAEVEVWIDEAEYRVLTETMVAEEER